jgi:hypothetical protein
VEGVQGPTFDSDRASHTSDCKLDETRRQNKHFTPDFILQTEKITYLNNEHLSCKKISLHEKYKLLFNFQ